MDSVLSTLMNLLGPFDWLFTDEDSKLYSEYR